MSLAPPPDGEIYATLEEAIVRINAHAARQGYAVVKQRTKARLSGGVYLADLQCDQSGVYRAGVAEEARQRQGTTRRIECPFQMQLRSDSGGWTSRIRTAEHNHKPTEAIIHSVHRSLPDSAIFLLLWLPLHGEARVEATGQSEQAGGHACKRRGEGERGQGRNRGRGRGAATATTTESDSDLAGGGSQDVNMRQLDAQLSAELASYQPNQVGSLLPAVARARAVAQGVDDLLAQRGGSE